MTITRRLDLWERDLQTGLAVYTEVEGATNDDRAIRGGKEEDEQKYWSYHSRVMSGKLRQAIQRSTDREGGGCLLLDDQCTNTGRPVVEVLREKHPDTRFALAKNPMCTAFK